MYLPKRDELSLRTVRALPNASKMGLDCSTCCSISPRRAPSPLALPSIATYFMMILHVSVLPAPAPRPRPRPVTQVSQCVSELMRRRAVGADNTRLMAAAIHKRAGLLTITARVPLLSTGRRRLAHSPDSPLTRMDWLRRLYSVVGSVMLRYALSARAYTWGAMVSTYLVAFAERTRQRRRNGSTRQPGWHCVRAKTHLRIAWQC
jgi:hypothetical protein